MLKDDADTSFVVVGSNTDKYCAYRAICDEWITEPKFDTPNEYVDYCIKFSQEHNIEVFVPRRNMLAVAKRRSEFDTIGVEVLVERNVEQMRVLNNKAVAYAALKDSSIGYVPPYRVANSIAEFEKAYSDLKTSDNRVCFKFTHDEGAISFRVVDNRIIDCSGLRHSVGAKVTYNDALTMLADLVNFPELMLMPYLPGNEVSVDCLRTVNGNIIIPRYKTYGRAEKICFDSNIEHICEVFMQTFDLDCPFNVQFKYDGKIPYFLEVNTRMSGGIQLSCGALGVNIPNIAVNQLLGINKQWSLVKRGAVVSYIETPLEVLND
jgi:hypothetical protein